MDVRHLRYFVAVADTLSFGKAARGLHMSQPPLSRRIADLEEELGVRLFDRSTKQVALSKAGQALLPHAHVVLEALESGVRAVQAVSLDCSKRLRIALPVDTSPDVATDIVNELRKEEVKIELAELGMLEQQRLIARGELDVGIFRHPFDTRGLKVSAPLAEPLGAVMQVDHPLAACPMIRLADLKPYPLLQFQRTLAPELYDEMLEICERHGYTPATILHGQSMPIALADNPYTVTFLTESALAKQRQLAGGMLVWRPLEGSPMHRWKSMVCRLHEWDQLKRLAFRIIGNSLQRHEHSVPLPRPTLGRGRRPRKHRDTQSAER
jgi:DNA-binding transcriptional LysR family regulator